MELWLNLAAIDTGELVHFAMAAEECGYTGLAVADHLVHPGAVKSLYPYSETGDVAWKATTHWPDAWVAIAAMAAVTTRLRFTTAVYVAPLRDPIALAKSVSTAAVISGGRVGCGFGSGWMREEFDLVGQTFSDRGRRLDEIIDVLRTLWSGEMVGHHGAYYSFEPVQMSPPPPGPIQVWLGGNTAPAMRRAVRHDGWIGSYTGLRQTIDDVEKVRALRRAGGHAGAFHVSVTGPGIDVAACRALAGEGIDAAIVSLRRIAHKRTGPDAKAAMQAFADEVQTATG
jgi:probable F420-dependent oxidoreductase